MEKSKEKALSAFRSPPLFLNCSQAVAHGLDRDDLREQLSNCGQGRAPDGLCGAVYAAALIAGENAADVFDAFKQKNGSVFCRELKTKFRVPCPQCVACAVEICKSRNVEND